MKAGESPIKAAHLRAELKGSEVNTTRLQKPAHISIIQAEITHSKNINWISTPKTRFPVMEKISQSQTLQFETVTVLSCYI